MNIDFEGFMVIYDDFLRVSCDKWLMLMNSCLVAAVSTPLKNMKVNWDAEIPN